MFKTFNCSVGFDCRPDGLHQKREKTKTKQKQPKRKRKNPHQETSSEINPRNLVFTSPKAYSSAQYGVDHKIFPSRLAHVFVLLSNYAYGNLYCWAGTNELLISLTYAGYPAKKKVI